MCRVSIYISCKFEISSIKPLQNNSYCTLFYSREMIGKVIGYAPLLCPRKILLLLYCFTEEH